MEIHVRVIPKGWKIYRMNGLRVCVPETRPNGERRLFVFGVIPPPLLLFLYKESENRFFFCFFFFFFFSFSSSSSSQVL
jgi:hypothetical protein